MIDLVDSVLNQGQYLIKGLISQTAESCVWEALDRESSRTGDNKVAIKASEQHGLLSSERNNLRDILSHASTTSSADGCPCNGAFDHFPAVYDLFSEEGLGLSFLVLELLGPSLETILSHQKLDLRDAKDMLRQTSCALQAIHGQGKAHWDVKASNIALRRKKVKGHRVWKLLDFSLLSGQETPPDFFTARYAPPESFLLNNPNINAGVNRIRGSSYDMWSYGCLAYESCTGEKLFDRSPVAKPDLFALGDVAEQEEDRAMLRQMVSLLGPPPSSINFPTTLKISLPSPLPPLLPSSIFAKLPDPLLNLVLPVVQRSREGSWKQEEVQESLRLRILRTSPMSPMNEEDVSDLAAFLSPLLTWDPSKRASAFQASKHKFLQKKT